VLTIGSARERLAASREGYVNDTRNCRSPV
jgi:hypothetical protein